MSSVEVRPHQQMVDIDPNQSAPRPAGLTSVMSRSGEAVRGLYDHCFGVEPDFDCGGTFIHTDIVVNVTRL